MQESISNEQLVDAYIKYRGLKRLEGEGQDISCLVPLLLLDMHLQLFTTSVSGIKCSHETQQARTRWRECYNRFNKGSFLAFNNDYKDAIIDLMDDLSEYISNNVMFLRVAVMDVFKDQMDVDDQARVADILLCNTFAQLASSWHGSVFKRVSVFHKFEYQPEYNHEIDGMIRRSLEFCNGYVNDCLHYKGKARLKDHPAIVNATNALDRRVSEWVISKNNQNKTTIL